MKATTTYTDSIEPWRRLASAILLGAALGAHAGNQSDIMFIHTTFAKLLADLVGLPTWPPAPEQLAGRYELARRAKWTAGVEETPGALRVRSRNPDDKGPEPWRSGPAVVDSVEWSYAGVDGPD